MMTAAQQALAQRQAMGYAKDEADAEAVASFVTSIPQDVTDAQLRQVFDRLMADLRNGHKGGDTQSPATTAAVCDAIAARLGH